MSIERTKCSMTIIPNSFYLQSRLKPGRMLLVDTEEKQIIQDVELKLKIAKSRPHSKWLKEQVYSSFQFESIFISNSSFIMPGNFTFKCMHYFFKENFLTFQIFILYSGWTLSREFTNFLREIHPVT